LPRRSTRSVMFSAQDENNPCLTKSGELLHRNTNLRSCACSAAPLSFAPTRNTIARPSTDHPNHASAPWRSAAGDTPHPICVLRCGNGQLGKPCQQPERTDHASRKADQVRSGLL
jgi:hypothetical protein